MRKKNKHKNSHKGEAENHENEQHSVGTEQIDHDSEEQVHRHESYGSRNIDDVIKENKELSDSIAKLRKKMCEDNGLC